MALYEGSYKVAKGLLKEFGGRRVIDTPVCEGAAGAPFLSDVRALLESHERLLDA